MFRKFFAALVALMFVVGGLFAEEIKGVFKKLDGDKITIEVDGKEKTYTVGNNAKIKAGEKEVAFSDVAKRIEGKTIVLTVEKDTVTGGKMERGK